MSQPLIPIYQPCSNAFTKHVAPHGVDVNGCAMLTAPLAVDIEINFLSLAKPTVWDCTDTVDGVSLVLRNLYVLRGGMCYKAQCIQTFSKPFDKHDCNYVIESTDSFPLDVDIDGVVHELLVSVTAQCNIELGLVKVSPTWIVDRATQNPRKDLSIVAFDLDTRAVNLNRRAA